MRLRTAQTYPFAPFPQVRPSLQTRMIFRLNLEFLKPLKTRTLPSPESSISSSDADSSEASEANSLSSSDDSSASSESSSSNSLAESD